MVFFQEVDRNLDELKDRSDKLLRGFLIFQEDGHDLGSLEHEHLESIIIGLDLVLLWIFFLFNFISLKIHIGFSLCTSFFDLCININKELFIKNDILFDCENERPDSTALGRSFVSSQSNQNNCEKLVDSVELASH